MPEPFRRILGVNFYVSNLGGLLDRLTEGGLFVVPSAPVMTRLAEDGAHREALEGADVAVTDSGLMVLLWLLKTGERVTRISGLGLLRGILERGQFAEKGGTFWVMPSAEDSAANREWLNGRGYPVGGADTYVAPIYPTSGPIEDERLLEILSALRPRCIVIALSGGVQERLGWYLRQKLPYAPTLLCIGGAIAFLSGRQIGIPVWADRLAIGWLFRWVSSPRSFSAKVSGVHRLAPLIWRYGSRSVSEGR